MIITYDHMKSLESNIITTPKYKSTHVVKFKCMRGNDLMKCKYFLGPESDEYMEYSRVIYINIKGKDTDDFAPDIEGHPLGGCKLKCIDQRHSRYSIDHTYSLISNAVNDDLFIIRALPSGKCRVDSYSTNHVMLNSIFFHELW